MKTDWNVPSARGRMYHQPEDEELSRIHSGFVKAAHDTTRTAASRSNQTRREYGTGISRPVLPVVSTTNSASIRFPVAADSTATTLSPGLEVSRYEASPATTQTFLPRVNSTNAASKSSRLMTHPAEHRVNSKSEIAGASLPHVSTIPRHALAESANFGGSKPNSDRSNTPSGESNSSQDARRRGAAMRVTRSPRADNRDAQTDPDGPPPTMTTSVPKTCPPPFTPQSDCRVAPFLDADLRPADDLRSHHAETHDVIDQFLMSRFDGRVSDTSPQL